MTRMRSLLAVAAAAAAGLTLGSPTAAEVPRLVRDINVSVFHHEGSAGGSFATLGTIAVLEGDDGGSGRELYRTDGTPAGTALVRDLVPGRGESTPAFLGAFGGRAYFDAWTGAAGHELWRTNGTGAGTLLLKDIFPGEEDSWPTDLTPLGAIGLFFATDAVHGRELWRTDGTWAGTQLVRDIRAGPGSSAVGDSYRTPLAFGSFVYFVADDGATGAELWRSDGTAAGTTQVVDLFPGASGSNPGRLALLGDRLLFAASLASGCGLWSTDGTGAGTALVRNFPVGWDYCPDEPVTVGARVYFSADDGVVGRELWATDGTPAGTSLVREIVPGPYGGYFRHPTAVGDRLYFFADDGDHGFEPWVSDGSAMGTLPLGDLRPGNYGSCPTYDAYWEGETAIAPHAGGALLAVDDGATGTEPWVSDGTPAGTRRLVDLAPGPASSYPLPRGVPFGATAFAAWTPSGGLQLYAVDAASSGVEQLTDLGRLVSPSYPIGLFDLDGKLLFSAGAEGEGYAPWRSNGTVAGTVALQGSLGNVAGNVSWFVALPAGRALGVTDEYEEGTLLWSTNGSSIDVVDFFCAACGHWICGIEEGPFAAGADVVFAWMDEAAGMELWSTDGTPPGTGRLVDIRPGEASSWPERFLALPTGAAFLADDGVHGREIWTTEGTPGSTVLAVDMVSGPGHPGALDLWAFAGRPGSYFLPRRGVDWEWELWAYDGTSSSLVQVATGFDSYSLWPLQELEGLWLFLGAPEGEWRNDELWVSDGTAAGTFRLAEIWPGPTGCGTSSATRLGDRVYFNACEPVAGCELWATDGTIAGTALFRDLEPGGLSSDPSGLTTIGDRFYFGACTVGAGCEPWVSDGSPAGTHRIADLAPGYFSGFGGSTRGWGWASVEFEPSGPEIYFPADDGTGTELWAMPIELFYDGFETGDTTRWSGVGEP